jgi:glycopeptide antibiotics resistance protein
MGAARGSSISGGSRSANHLAPTTRRMARRCPLLDGRLVYLAAVPLALVILALRLGAFRSFVALVAVAHLAILASVALFPLPVSADVFAGQRAAAVGPYAGSSLNVIPFATIGPVFAGRGGSVVREIAVLNLFVLAPAGIYLPLLFARLRSWRAFLIVAVVGGLSIEAAQLGISLAIGFRYRVIDVDDAILNTIGLFVGWAAFRLVLAASGRDSVESPRAPTLI